MQFIGAPLAYFFVYNFGRITLLFWGHISMGLLWGAVGFCTLYDYNIIAIILILVYIFVFAVTEGTVIWIYCAEVLNDYQFGVAIFGLFANFLIISLVT